MSRVLVVVLAIVALALALYNALAPDATRTLGIGTAYHSGALVATVTPGGPAAQAGIRTGDRIALNSTPLRVRAALVHADIFPRAGVYVIPVVRSNGIAFMSVRAGQSNTLSTSDARYADLGLAFLYLAFALIVAVKAPRTRLSELLVALMVILTLTNSLADCEGTLPTTLQAFFAGGLLQYLSNVALGALVFMAIAELPVGWDALRGRLRAFAVPLGLLGSAGPEIPRLLSAFWPVLLSAPVVSALTFVAVACMLFGIIVTVVLVQSAPREHRVRARWFASSLVVCWFFGFALWDVNQLSMNNEAITVAMYYLISFSLVGPVYATLRHRLVDVDVVLSRSAIFAAVSVLLVMAFVAAEWLAGKVADELVGGGRWHGLTMDALSFAAAIAIGLSVRGVHARVERWVNSLVFRDRARRLRLLENFAHEADLIDSRETLLKLAYESLVESLETNDIALYISDGKGFACVRTSSDMAPERLDKSDRMILRLLYRPEPFVSEHPTLHGWQIVPLMVRADVTGFLACGIKHDRTAYLADEMRVLETLSHHMATSYALLSGDAGIRRQMGTT